GEGADAADPVQDALDRAKAYQAAGASGFFIPGLQEAALIGRMSEGVSLPVNVMVMEGVPSDKRLSELGVARISYGPIPYIDAMEALKKKAQRVHPKDKTGPPPTACVTTNTVAVPPNSG